MNSTRFKDPTNGLGWMHAGLKLFGVLYTFSLLIEESMTKNIGEVFVMVPMGRQLRHASFL